MGGLRFHLAGQKKPPDYSEGKGNATETPGPLTLEVLLLKPAFSSTG